MKGSKKLNQLLEDNEKKLKKLFKYDKKEALSFTKEDRKSRGSVWCICDIRWQKPVFVGQTGGYSTGYKPIQKDLNSKLAQYNSKSDSGTTKFRRELAKSKKKDTSDLKGVTAEEYGLTFQYIKVKDEPAFINILEILALEYAKQENMKLYNFQ